MSGITTAVVGTATILVDPEYVNPNNFANCTVDTCSVILSFYNYRIDLAANAAFLAIHSFWFLGFLTIWIRTKRGLFFSTSMLPGLACEIIGYAGRVISYENQWNQDGFLMQIICITLGPTFFSAGIYVCLAYVITVYGAKNSRLPPIWFTRIVSPDLSMHF